MKKALAFTLVASAVFCVHAEFCVGFSKVDITPPLGTGLSGYSYERKADGILDPLDAIAVAFSDGTNRAVVISADIINLRGYFDLYRKAVAAETGLDPQAVFIACTHTHTGPMVGSSTYTQKLSSFKKASVYEKSLKDKLSSLVKLALNDLSPAKMSVARGEAKGISFIRRFRMKDGSCRTNPGVGNPDIVAPMSEPDEQVQLVRVDRQGKKSIAIVNFQCHPDTVSGSKISADWPRVVRETVECVLEDVECVLINGAQGDSNHICVDPKRVVVPKGSKRMHIHMGRVIAGSVIGLWDICAPIASGKVGYGITVAKVKSNRGTPDQLPEARRIQKLVKEKRVNEIPGSGMMRITNIAQARRICFLANGPDYFELPLSAVTVGDTLAFVGFPGEPFTGYGVAMKKKSPFAVTIPACIVNGNSGYLPVDAAFRESGYETQGSFFVEGLEKTMVESHLKQLNRLIER